MKNSCEDCIRNTLGRCDVLGEITEENKKICYNAGYRECHYIPNSWFGIRRYNNKRGAYWSTKDTEGRMS